MGPAPQSVRARRTAPRGVALVTVILIMVAMGAIAAALFATVGSQGRAEFNRADARRAELLAQAGAAHAVSLIEHRLAGLTPTALLLGADGAAGGNDDGLLTGRGLPTDQQIPAAGVQLPGMGTYYVRVIDDESNVAADVLSGAQIGGSAWADGGTHNPNYTTAPVDNNNRVLLQCLGVTTGNRARSIVNVRVRRDPAPGLTIGGSLQVGAQVIVQGSCADVHANGQIIDSRGSANWGKSFNYPVASLWSSTTGTIPIYFQGTKLENQPERGIPVVPDFETLCAGVPAAQRYYAMAVANRTATINLDNLADGTIVCAYGNVAMSCSNNCKAGGSRPRIVSVIATGSIRFTLGNSGVLGPAHPEGYQFVAFGDLDITESGSRSLTLTGQGTTFCASQIRLDTDLAADGQVICAGLVSPIRGPAGPTPGAPVDFNGTSEFFTINAIAKAATINFNCNGALANLMQIISWYPSVGS